MERPDQQESQNVDLYDGCLCGKILVGTSISSPTPSSICVDARLAAPMYSRFDGTTQYEGVLSKVGKFRYDVWTAEGVSMNLDPSLKCVWLDSLDYGEAVRHWVVYAYDDSTKEPQIAATARLTLHHSQDISQPRDVALWINKKMPLSYPVCDLGRLVVHKQWRKRGIANELNRLRVEFASREFGAKMIIATASQGNARLLERIGFIDIGERIEFDDRPGIVFSALQLLL